MPYTIDDAIAEFTENINWHGNRAKAEKLYRACAFLLAARPQSIAQAGANLGYNTQMLSDLLKELSAYLQSVGAGRRKFTTPIRSRWSM